MAVHSLSIGATLIIRGTSYKLINKLEDGRIQFHQPDTSELATISREEILSLYASGAAEFELRGLPTPSGAYWFTNYGDKPFSQYTEDEQHVAERRERYVKAVKAAGFKYFTKVLIDPIIKQCALDKEHPDDDPPSFISVYRWKKRYEASDCDIRSLIDQRASQGDDTPKVKGRVRELAVVAIDEEYLTLERHKMEETKSYLKKLLIIENKQCAPSQRLHCPSTKYLKKVLHEEWDEFTITERRYGKLAANREFRAALGRQERPTRPMQRVELDHTLLDIIVVDDETFMILGRPVIAFAVDALTRCIAGFGLGFEQPSAATVTACLKHAILPKTYLKSAYPDIKNAWECMGNIETLVGDRAFENLGRRLASACRHTGIDLEFNKSRSGWGKGIVERLNRTISEGLIHTLPGTTFSNIFEKGDYQPMKNAIITKSAILHAIHLWIVDIYHQSFHRGIHDSPAHKWQVAIAGCPVYLPRSARDLEIALGMPEHQKLWHYGIEINRLKYNNELLTELRKVIGNEQFVDFMWYSENLGYVDVLDPTTKEYIRVRCVEFEYANGLTLYQHNMNTAFAKVEFDGRYDIAALIEAKAKLREIVKRCITKKRGTTRKRQTRYLQGHGFGFPEAQGLNDTTVAAVTRSVGTPSSANGLGTSTTEELLRLKTNSGSPKKPVFETENTEYLNYAVEI